MVSDLVKTSESLKLTVYARESTFLYAGIGQLFINILRENYTVADLKVRIPFVNYFNQTYNRWAILSFFMLNRWDRDCIDEFQDQLQKYLSKCSTIAIVYPYDDEYLKILKPTYHIVEQCCKTQVSDDKYKKRSEIFLKEEDAISWLLEREPELNFNISDLSALVKVLL